MNPMRLAIESAREGIHKKEGGPFGAVIVCGGKIIAVAHNTVLKDSDPTAHAEVNAIRLASKKLGIDLSNCEIYSTAEPCPMCFSAIHWARIKKIYFGATIEDAARHGFHELSLKNEKIKKLTRDPVEIESGVLQEECVQLFEEYDKLGGEKY